MDNPLLEKESTQKIPLSTLIAINIPWFAIWFHATIIGSIIMPNQVAHYVGAGNEGFGFGIVNLVAGIVGSFVTPVVGSLSDNTKTKIGRRKPWIIGGILLNTCVGFYLTFSPSLAFFAIGMGLDVLTMTGVYAPLSSLIPDLIPKEQRGTASGFMQLFTNAGALSACVVGLFAPDLGTIPHAWQFNAYAFEMFFMIFLVIVVVSIFVHENVDNEDREKNTISNLIRRLKTFISWNFLVLAIVSLFSIGFGNTIVQGYYQYYVTDLIHLPFKIMGYEIKTAESASALFIFAMLLGCAIASYPAGKLADTMDRRLLMTISLLLQLAAPVGLCLYRRFELDLVYAFVYGLGYSSYAVVSFAMLTDILGSEPLNLKEGEYAMGTGLYYFVQFLPSSITPLLYGYIIDHYHKQGQPLMGYYLLYGQCALGFLIGCVVVWFLRVKPKKGGYTAIQ